MGDADFTEIHSICACNRYISAKHILMFNHFAFRRLSREIFLHLFIASVCILLRTTIAQFGYELCISTLIFTFSPQELLSCILLAVNTIRQRPMIHFDQIIYFFKNAMKEKTGNQREREKFD